MGNDELTVMDNLWYVETHKAGWTAGQLAIAYGILDAMNNAENNMYVMFIARTGTPRSALLTRYTDSLSGMTIGKAGGFEKSPASLFGPQLVCISVSLFPYSEKSSLYSV